jgi:hypothetical protein
MPAEGKWRAISETGGNNEAKMFIQKGSKMNEEEFDDEDDDGRPF